MSVVRYIVCAASATGAGFRDHRATKSADSPTVERPVGEQPLADMSRMSPGDYETFVSA